MALPSVSVLITVGMIIGIWIASGTVPTIIYYGLKTLSPEIFLAADMIICAVVSVSLGTSWGSVGTVGLALMGIGEGFDIPMYWTAGAVVSGAFFGDKVSLLSDTTNLAPAVTGTDVFSHIKKYDGHHYPCDGYSSSYLYCRWFFVYRCSKCVF